jgi:uncharacterized membrane protein YdjX (TVP38/TMEM64 family)
MTTDPTVPSGPLAGDHDDPALDPEYRPQRLAISTLLGVLTFFGAVAAVLYFYKDAVIAAGEGLVRVAGGPGLALIWMLLDMSPVPVVPNDVFSTLAVIGGMNLWVVTLWCTLGSICGGLAARSLAMRLAHRPLVVRLVTEGKSARLFRLVGRHQKLALAIGAITPVPYSLTAWGAGLTNMELRPFILVSLFRFPRIVFYLLLFEKGLVNALDV